jgi:Icc-related predicted phosphoesterase
MSEEIEAKEKIATKICIFMDTIKLMENLVFFVTDLHGNTSRFEKLFHAIEKEKPAAVFLGGDLLPTGLFAYTSKYQDFQEFFTQFLLKNLADLKNKLGKLYPRIFLILGNDDGKFLEDRFLESALSGVWEYMHGRKCDFQGYPVYGYSYVPPTPFRLKDWEKYDVSRYTPPGCVPPESGSFSTEVDLKKLQFETIEKDLKGLVGGDNLSKAIFLFHSPPYETDLDRAALDGQMFDHVPLDVHVGSIAIKRFIEDRQPLLTLHGHVHESAAITGHWHQKIGKTWAMNAAHNGPELSLIRFTLENPENATRQLM